MKNKLRLFLGIAIIILGCSIPSLEKLATPLLTPREPSIREVMSIERPQDDLRAGALKLDEIVTDKKDEEALAVFNREFADRVSEYDTKGQAVLGIYSAAGEMVFDKELQEKYDGKIKAIVEEAFREILVDYDTQITDEQREALKKKFNSLAWVLGGEEDE